MQAQIADFGNCVETVDNEIACPNGRGDCPGVVDELRAFEDEFGSLCLDCYNKSIFPDGEPEEVEADE